MFLTPHEAAALKCNANTMGSLSMYDKLREWFDTFDAALKEKQPPLDMEPCPDGSRVLMVKP